MRKQVGARYLHKSRTRKDESFTGIVRIANRRNPVKRLASGAVKRINA